MTRTAYAIVCAFAVTMPAVAAQDAGGFGTGARRPGPGIESPRLLASAVAQYPQAAIDAKVQGDVELEIVVKTDGTVGEVRVVRSADKTFGLDEAAVAAARQCTFTPGSINGQSVPVIQRLLESFVLMAAWPGKLVDLQVVPVDDEFATNARRPGMGVRAPTLVSRVLPQYSREAMRQKIQGAVTLEAIVEPDGTVGPVRVIKSLDSVYGLDDAAVAAAKRWTFNPGTLDGQPIRVIVKLVLEFRLHGTSPESAVSGPRAASSPRATSEG